jgi:hypothetical protein
MGVFRIRWPSLRVEINVIAYPFQLVFAANDVLVIIALPKDLPRRTAHLVYLLAGNRLERTDQLTQWFYFLLSTVNGRFTNRPYETGID